jgi:hypothetical protein
MKEEVLIIASLRNLSMTDSKFKEGLYKVKYCPQKTFKTPFTLLKIRNV